MLVINSKEVEIWSYNSDRGYSLVMFSSNTNNAGNAGTFYLNANNATSNANVNISTGNLINQIYSK